MRRLSPALVAVVAALGVAWAVVTSGGDDGYTVRVRTGDAAGLRQNADVRIAGVRVGKVERIELAADDVVVAELGIDDSVAPIGRGARVAIRAKNLLGHRLVDVDPGDVTHPVASGSVIPRSRVSAPVDLDDVLAVLDPDIRTRLRILTHESGVALAGRGADFNRLLDQLPSSLDRVGRLVAAFASDNRALARLLTESDRVVGAVARERASLGALVDNAAGALAATASRRRELGATLRRAPATVVQIRRTLTRLQETALPLRPAAVALRQTARPLTAVLEELPQLVPTARRTLARAHATAPDLSRLARAATPLVRRLRPTSDRLAEFATEFDPLSKTLDAGIEDTLATLEGWARAIQGRDGLGHVFRGAPTLSPDLATTLVKRFVGARRPDARKRTEQPGDDRPGAQVLDLLLGR